MKLLQTLYPLYVNMNKYYFPWCLIYCLSHILTQQLYWIELIFSLHSLSVTEGFAVFTTRLSWVFGGSAVNFNAVFVPGDHNTLGYSAASSQAGNLGRRQNPIPEANLRQLSDQSLGWIKTST